jgi:hypothetical protein
MRFILAAALAVVLSGCGSSDFFGDTTPSSPAAAPSPQVADTTGTAEQPPGSPAAAQTVAVAPDIHCTKLAKQRAIDAAYEGEDPDTQRAVYDRSYSDCMAWDAKHRS